MTTKPTISICAWCDPLKEHTNQLERIGYKVSHTCCLTHRDAMLARAKELNEKRKEEVTTP